MLVTPALPAPYRQGLAASRNDRQRQVPAVTPAEADPQERARTFYASRSGDALAIARPLKGRILNISA